MGEKKKLKNSKFYYICIYIYIYIYIYLIKSSTNIGHCPEQNYEVLDTNILRCWL